MNTACYFTSKISITLSVNVREIEGESRRELLSSTVELAVFSLASAEEGAPGNNVIGQPSVDDGLLNLLELVVEAESEAGAQFVNDAVVFALGKNCAVVRADFEGSTVEVFLNFGNSEGDTSGISALASDSVVAVISE